MATLILSYPAAVASNPTSHKALQDWLLLCDHLTRAGARILVLDPPPDGADLRFTSQIGALFQTPRNGNGPVFLLGQHAASEHLLGFFERAGLPVVKAAGPWAGQADLIALARNRFILTRTAATDRAVLDQVRDLLPPGARVLELELEEGWPHGNACLSHVVTQGGDHILLCYSGALRGAGPDSLSQFTHGEVDVLPLQYDDALAMGATALAVRGTLFLPSDLSTGLRGVLVRRGFHLVELDLPHLLGDPADRRGLRALVNELPGLVLSDTAPSYGLRREELHRL